MQLKNTATKRRCLPDETVLRLLPISEVGLIAGRGKTWLMEAVRKGQFPIPKKIAGRLFWSNLEVQEWVAKQLASRADGEKSSRTPEGTPMNQTC